MHREAQLVKPRDSPGRSNSPTHRIPATGRYPNAGAERSAVRYSQPVSRFGPGFHLLWCHSLFLEHQFIRRCQRKTNDCPGAHDEPSRRPVTIESTMVATGWLTSTVSASKESGSSKAAN